MEITKTYITIRDLCEGYINDSETKIEDAVMAYNGKLCVRPAFQRAFVYDKKQEGAVINTTIKGFPLNIMYWVDNGDGTYDCLDGQQRTISLCNFVDGISSFVDPWFNANHAVPSTFRLSINSLKRVDPDLYERFMNYELEVYICKGEKAERMEWFRTINIAGEELYPQELRNANYVSAWLTDAKRYFSKASTSSTASCPAERIGKAYTNKNANRQEILEQVIGWAAGSNDDTAICQYMEDHINDADASELWAYFNNIIDWVKELFPGECVKGMSSVNWGALYNLHGEDDLDPDEINEKLSELIARKEANELDVSMAKIIEYCITRDEKLLKHRQFNDVQRTTLYNRQKGICPDCGQYFSKADMHAHHIIPWYGGGRTELENGVMLCKKCHTSRHANS
jgi:hypothetical protein